ncbi:hypothetical protein A9Q74_00310 [Colwellia sp. 39_35_sub15_T18]|nr:hypothetical protein A9Q74_00310 [Colwellia sp. 39_35_sub15_T18]
MFKNLAIGILSLLLNACSINEDAGVVYHDSFDFSAVQSYSLYDRNSAFSDTQSLLDSRRNAIEIAIERMMAKKNFSYTAPEQADVIVTYYLLNGSRSDYSNYNEVVHFCQYCLRATTWKTSNRYATATHGSLILDLVDPKKQRSVWRSVYPLNIKDKDNSAKSNEKIQQAVASMLAQYPTSNITRTSAY